MNASRRPSSSKSPRVRAATRRRAEPPDGAPASTSGASSVHAAAVEGAGNARQDRGAHAREQLVAHATRIFAAKGYAAASTREICQAAGTNVASIHYYFGDKEGLYREVLTRPVNAIIGAFGNFDDPALPFEQSIRQVLHPFVAMALDDHPDALHVERVHLREALEPSAVFREVVARMIVPQHQALATVLARHCGLRRPDAAIHQLAFALIAMANDYCMSREFMEMLAPSVIAQRDAVRHIVERLVGYSVALLAHEQGRRAAPDPARASTRTTHRAAGAKS